MTGAGHFYVFCVTADSYVFYERTCGNKQAAETRIGELKKLYRDAFYTENELPKVKWFY